MYFNTLAIGISHIYNKVNAEKFRPPPPPDFHDSPALASASFTSLYQENNCKLCVCNYGSHFHNNSGEWYYNKDSGSEGHLILAVSPCVSIQERPSPSWIVCLQRLDCTYVFTINSFGLSLSANTHTYIFNPASRFVFGRCVWVQGVWASSAPHISLNWMPVRDAWLPQWNCDVAAWFRLPCICWYLLLLF